MKVPLSAIQFDPETQPRVQMDLFVIREYADAMSEGAEFPPVALFEEDGKYWIGDGFHRCQAARDLGLADIEAEVKPGGKREAILVSCGANADHGTRRKNADIERAMRRLFADEEWRGWPDQRIAEVAHVTQQTANNWRHRILQTLYDSGAREIERGDSTYIMQTRNIARPLGEGLTAEALEVARQTDIRANHKDIDRVARMDADLQLPILNLVAEGMDANKAIKQVVGEHQDKETPALPEGVFNVICADPPWAYDFSASDSRRIEKQYPTMTLEAIKLLAVQDVAHSDAVLFLWATSPKLREALEVVEAWGFTYKTCMVWQKDRIGMGYWARQTHELLLIATQGAPQLPEPGARPKSVLAFPRGDHSEKPPGFYEVIEQMCPDATRLELFSRGERDGWTCWGNEVLTGD